MENRKKQVSRGTRFLTAITVMILLAACTGGDAGDTTTSAATGGEGEGVSVVAWFNGETVPADEFGALEADGVTVSYDIRGDAVLTDMLRMADAGEQLPDLVEIDSHLTPAFMEAGLLAPMTEQIATWEEEDPELYATVPESVWEDGTYDGEIYHFPNKSLVDALFYNVAMLEEAGAAPPPYETYWEMLDAARAVQAVNPDLAAYFATGGASHDRMFRWLYSFGVPFEGNVPDVNTDQGIEMIDWLQTMYEEGITDPEFMINQADEGKGAFVAGELPFIEEGLNGSCSTTSSTARTGSPPHTRFTRRAVACTSGSLADGRWLPTPRTPTRPAWCCAICQIPRSRPSGISTSSREWSSRSRSSKASR
jgi:ABC-type glycerol-3-phosphate transport system substrate-binding protein